MAYLKVLSLYIHMIYIYIYFVYIYMGYYKGYNKRVTTKVLVREGSGFTCDRIHITRR